ncbi:hypothetical protein K1719_017331 [Acacia pycnantha]|nr:hypothetical protein K1719_017331 [Acacia pycnantha]
MWHELKRGSFEPEFLVLEGTQWFDWNLRITGCLKMREAVVRAHVADIISAKVEFGRLNGAKVWKQICWTKPRVGWVKLNTDGASRGDVKLAGCGGLLRDSLLGLELAFQCNVQLLCIESDSSTVVSLLNGSKMELKEGCDLLQEIGLDAAKIHGGTV